MNGERLPIYVADYVLMDYGTGAIMAVPAHDERDREFAEAFDLPSRRGRSNEDGVLVNSGEFDGLPADEGSARSSSRCASEGRGAPAVSYRLRDWSFSRQRYWGCPIPIVHCDDCGVVPVPDDELPCCCPRSTTTCRRGSRRSPPTRSGCTCRARAAAARRRREADTMDTFVDSSWYFLRYVDPHNDEAPFDRALVDYWLPVIQYIGGIDHADRAPALLALLRQGDERHGLVGFREPFARLFHQGWVQMGGTKMSKTQGNVTGPDELVEAYGADAVRLYILFMGPADQDMEWTRRPASRASSRFLRRLWRIVQRGRGARARARARRHALRARRTRRSRA